MTRRRVYDVPGEEFTEVVAASLSLREMIRRLGLHDHTNTYHRLRQRIDELHIDTSHFCGTGRRPRRYSQKDLEQAAASSRSIRQTLQVLGIKAEGGNYKTIRRDIDAFGIDTSHFTSRGWRKGEASPVTRVKPLKEVLVRDSTLGTSQLRKRLRRHGLLGHSCQICGVTEWMGRSLTLELDHINGVSNDHRLKNLRLLCPNCHSQTATFRGRNQGRYGAKKATQLSIL
jgi:hypothetical protein